MRAQKLKAGECDIMSYPAPADIDGLQADTNLTVTEQEGLNIGYLAYNVTEAPFDKVEVRKALNMAINKQAIIEAVYQGAGQAANNPIPPTMWSYNNVDRRTTPTIRKAPRRCWRMPALPTSPLKSGRCRFRVPTIRMRSASRK